MLHPFVWWRQDFILKHVLVSCTSSENVGEIYPEKWIPTNEKWTKKRKNEKWTIPTNRLEWEPPRPTTAIDLKEVDFFKFVAIPNYHQFERDANKSYELWNSIK